MALLLHCLKKLINTIPNTRIEKDSLGEIHILAGALHAAQTQRAIDSFPISHLPTPAGFIRTLALVKQCCAEANLDLKMIGYEKGAMIAKKSYREKRPIAEVVAEECPELSIEKIRALLNPMDLTTNDKK